MLNIPLNPHRGEVLLSLGGKTYKLCLTLGALAEIEAGLELSSIGEIGARMQNLSARDLWLMTAALLKGGGQASPDTILNSTPLDIPTLAQAVSKAFKAAMG